jgi:DNA-binding NarL/FixJ family response regulator
VSDTRNCGRCGFDFSSYAGQRICANCRKVPERPVLAGMSLSPRERQIGRMIVDGMENKEIAFELHLTEGTIKEYNNRVYRKLGICNRTQFAIWMTRNEPGDKTV